MTDKKNNDEILKVENLEKNEYLVSSSIVDVPKDEAESTELKVTVFKLLLYAIAPTKDAEKQPPYYSLRPVKTILYTLFAIFFAVFVYFCNALLDSKAFVPLFLICASIVVPLMFITFHYEINLRRNVSIFQIMFSFMFGIVLNVIIRAFSDSLLKSIYRDTIDFFIIPFLWGIGQSVFLAIYSKVYSITDTSTNILLAVCVGMGYAFFNSMATLYSELFRSVEIIISGSENYNGLAIVDSALYMEQSYKNILPQLPWNCLIFPFLVACWSIVMGTVASITKLLGTKKKDSSFSVYLLLLLVIILYILSVFPATIGYFEHILKIVCSIISLFVALRLENNAIYDTVNKMTDKLE